MVICMKEVGGSLMSTGALCCLWGHSSSPFHCACWAALWGLVWGGRGSDQCPNHLCLSQGHSTSLLTGFQLPASCLLPILHKAARVVTFDAIPLTLNS